MDKYSDKNVIIVGHSMGGSVACRITDILTNK
jgi:surfactin synthase thioesterase subunit